MSSEISQTHTAKFHMCISEVEESSLGKVKGTSQRVGVGEDQEGKVVVGEDVFLSAVVNNMTRATGKGEGFNMPSW